jgi:signal transduction histidine kinase
MIDAALLSTLPAPADSSLRSQALGNVGAKETAMESHALAQWAHDIRNTLSTVALHLESLERRRGIDAAGILARSDALLKKATSMCSDLMREAVQSSARPPRGRFDVMRTIEEVVELIAPIVPVATTLSLSGHGPVYVVADPQDVFRILFNLVHNAVGVARTAGTMRRIALSLAQNGATVTIRIADDGPGLPESVKSQLFRQGRSTTGSTGYGLSIARELAERNGALLELSEHMRGTEFTIALQAADPAIERKPTATRARWPTSAAA